MITIFSGDSGIAFMLEQQCVDNVDLFLSCAELLSLFDEMHVCHDIFGCIIIYTFVARVQHTLNVAVTNRSKLDTVRQST